MCILCINLCDFVLAIKCYMRYNGYMDKISLTTKQQETLKFIKDFISRNRKSPLITDIQNEFGLKSLRSVSQRLEALERKGLIKRDRFKHRGIALTDFTTSFEKEFIQVPVIASAGCDAMQIYAQETYDEYVSLDKKLVDIRKEIVAIKAVGNSMIDAGIRNGDYVLVEVTQNTEDGDRVVAMIGDMAVIKRLRKIENTTILEPESKGNGYSPIILSEGSRIFGKVLSVIPFSSPNTDDNNTHLVYEPGFKPQT